MAASRLNYKRERGKSIATPIRRRTTPPSGRACNLAYPLPRHPGTAVLRTRTAAAVSPQNCGADISIGAATCPSSFQFWRSSHSNVFPKEAYVREARQQSSRNNAGVQRERPRSLASLRNSEPATWAHRREGSLGAPIPIRKWQQTLPPVPVREDFGRLLAQTTQVGRSFLHQFSRI